MNTGRVLQSLRFPLLGLSVVPVLCLAIFLATAINLGRSVHGELTWTLHSSDVLARSHDLENAVHDEWHAVGAYLHFGTPQTYAAFVSAATLVPKSAGAVRTAVEDNDSQESLAVRISNDANAESASLRALMQRMRAGHRHAVFNRAYEERYRDARGLASGQNRFDAETLAFERAERSLRVARSAATEALWNNARIVLLAGSAIAVLATLLLNLTVGRRIIARLSRLAYQARQFGSGQIVVAPLEGEDELAIASRSIAEMATEIKRRDHVLFRYRLLAEKSLDSIVFLAGDTGAILEANAATVAAYGYSMGELLTMTGWQMLVPEQALVLAERTWEGSYTATVETEHMRKDGTRFPVELTLQSEVIDGKSVVICIIRDLTERRAAQELVRKALDQALEASRLKSVFVATMSHEIRTPMNGVIGMCELLLDTSLTKEQREYAGAAQDSANALLNVINGILDFSRLEAGHVELEVIEFDLRNNVESIATLYGAKAQAKGIALTTFVDPAIGRHLVGDALRLRQVLTNLLANAIKFTGEGSVSLKACIASSEADSISVSFEVRDTGIGMSSQTIATLFEPFTQADSSTTRKYGGTGLGLAISKSLVELMGGTVAVTSVEGQGSSFTFELRFHLGSTIAPPIRRILTNVRALIVSDEPMVYEVATRYAAADGIAMTAASTPGDALTMLASAAAGSTAFDLAIVDLRDGGEALRFAKSVRESAFADRLGLLFITVSDAPQKGPEAIRAGYSAYLVKPVTQSQVYECIANIVLGPIGHEQHAPAPSTAVKHGEKILVAEDNQVNRDVALRQLSKLGYSAEAVGDGQAAVDETRRLDYDLVFMDLRMPNMDGFEATKAIRGREALTGKHVPIVAMTANALPIDRNECLAAGMDDYLSKPVVLNDIRSILKRWLDSPDESNDLDRARIQELYEDDEAAIPEFLAAVVPSIGRLCGRIAATADLPHLAELAHELKGAAANIGARRLALAATTLEGDLTGATGREAVQGALTGIEDAWLALRDLMERTSANAWTKP